MNYSRGLGSGSPERSDGNLGNIPRCYGVDRRKAELACLGQIYESTIISIRDPGVLLWGEND